MATTEAEAALFQPTQILRSINVVLDIDQPDRIAHFMPTAKTARLLSEFFRPAQNPGYFIVAPYGSGKSLTATYFLQSLENADSSSRILDAITRRLARVDSNIAEAISERINPVQKPFFKARGMGLALSGYQADLPGAIKTAALASLRRIGLDEDASAFRRRSCKTMDECLLFLEGILSRLSPEKIDRVSLIWDEFGRHIEELVSRGRASSLNDIQVIAEFAARSRTAPFTVALLLHQSLMRYAAGISLTVQQEWRKIEGRFETIQFVDDSREVYELIGQIVWQNASRSAAPPALVEAGATAARKTGLFADFGEERLKQLIGRCYPLEPVALYLLPRISSRVAQNERSLFTFLFDAVNDQPVGPDLLFDYFSDSMQGDSSPGGTHRAWLETQSALTKVSVDLEARGLKTACLLGMGLAGERSRIGKELLLFGVAGFGQLQKARQAVESLLSKKLLLYRSSTDSVSVWHGTDVDLRGRADQAKSRLSSSFEIVPFLRQEVPLPIWKPIEYNDQYSVERSFESRYVTASDALAMKEASRESLGYGSSFDGLIFFVVPENEAELAELRKRIETGTINNPAILFAIPQRSEQLFELSLEVYALQSLLQDSVLLSEDPLVEPELQHMIDDAQSYLSAVLERSFSPSPEGPTFFNKGKAASIGSARELRSFLSNIMYETYPLTPKIRNELIVRQKPRQAIINARKKLILGILERSGRAEFGLEGNRPDMSMYRTVLFHTGLYFEDGKGTYSFAKPQQLKDKGLRKAWKTLETFLTTPHKDARSFKELLDVLEAPPIGLRKGLIPVFFAAALRAFPSAMAILDSHGRYLVDILPSTVEEICSSPADYSVHVFELKESELTYLAKIYNIFAPSGDVAVSEKEPLRRCYDALTKWLSKIPRSCLVSNDLSKPTSLFVRAIQEEQNPYRLFLVKLPELFDKRGSSRALIELVSQCKADLEGVVGKYYAIAKKALYSAISVRSESQAPVQVALRKWSGFYHQDGGSFAADGVSKAFLSRIVMTYDSEEGFIDSLSSLVIGRPVSRWDDSSVAAFDREVHAVITRIEESAWAHSTRSVSDEGLKNLATTRIRSLFLKLVDLVGEREARRIVAGIVNNRP